MQYKPLKLLNIALATLLLAVVFLVKIQGPDNLQVPLPANASGNTEPAAPTQTNTETATNENQTPLANQLFGTPSSTDNTVEPEKATLPSDVVLKGTITGPASVARAILSVKNIQTGETETVIAKLGDKLPGNFTITEINRDHITLENQGSTQKLWITTEAVKTTTNFTQTPPTQEVVTEKIELSLPKTINANRKMSESLSMDSQWTIASDTQNNTLGIKLENIKPLSQIALCGLRDGDVIKSINGQQLKSYQQVYQVLQKARVKKKIQLEIIRDGQTISFENNLTEEN